MSGRAKLNLYRIIELLLLCAVAAGVFFMFYNALKADVLVGAPTIAGCVVGVVLLLPVASVVLHEIGHLIFGLLAGLRFYSFSVRLLQIGRGGRMCLKSNPDFAGKTVMLPRNEKGVRAKLSCFAVGGAAVNLIYGLLFLILYFLLPLSPALLVFELLAPVSIFEGIIALYPVELSAGQSDGKILTGLIKNTDYARVMQGVLTAQGQLIDGGYAELSKDLIFSVPAIREDDPLFLSLTQLRLHYAYFHGETEEARAQLNRLRILCEYTTDEDAYLDWAWGTSILENNREEALAFLGENEIGLLPLVRFLLTGEGKAEALKEIDGERIAGLKGLKEKIFADSVK